MENWKHQLVILQNVYDEGGEFMMLMTSDNTQYSLGTGSIEDLKERAFRRFGIVRWRKDGASYRTPKFSF